MWCKTNSWPQTTWAPDGGIISYHQQWRSPLGDFAFFLAFLIRFDNVTLMNDPLIELALDLIAEINMATAQEKSTT